MAKDDELRHDDIYYLVEGICTLCIEGENGRDHALIYFTPGRLLNFMPGMRAYYDIGEAAHRKQLMYSNFYIKAIVDSKLYHIKKDDFLETFFYNLPLNSLIIKALMENCIDLLAHIFNAQESTAWQRVSYVVYELMNKEPPHNLSRKFTYQEISNRLFIHPVTVAKIFKALFDQNILKKANSEIIVSDPAKLLKIAKGKEQLFYNQNLSRGTFGKT